MMKTTMTAILVITFMAQGASGQDTYEVVANQQDGGSVLMGPAGQITYFEGVLPLGPVLGEVNPITGFFLLDEQDPLSPGEDGADRAGKGEKEIVGKTLAIQIVGEDQTQTPHTRIEVPVTDNGFDLEGAFDLTLSKSNPNDLGISVSFKEKAKGKQIEIEYRLFTKGFEDTPLMKILFVCDFIPKEPLTNIRLTVDRRPGFIDTKFTIRAADRKSELITSENMKAGLKRIDKSDRNSNIRFEGFWIGVPLAVKKAS